MWRSQWAERWRRSLLPARLVTASRRSPWTTRSFRRVSTSVGGLFIEVRFGALRDVGEPAAMAVQYEREGADELVFLDISATNEGRATLLSVVRRTAEQLFVPLTVGGGIRSTNDVMLALRSGADKVSLNSAAVGSPPPSSEAPIRFGTQY